MAFEASRRQAEELGLCCCISQSEERTSPQVHFCTVLQDLIPCLCDSVDAALSLSHGHGQRRLF